MRLVGKHCTINARGERLVTLHCLDQFDSFYKNVEAGRECQGEKVETVYVGAYDTSNLKPGMEIEIIYDKAIKTAKGMFQPIRRIDIINK